MIEKENKHFRKLFIVADLVSLNNESYMSAHVILNLLNMLRKRNNMRGLPNFYLFFATSLKNSIIEEHEC